MMKPINRLANFALDALGAVCVAGALCGMGACASERDLRFDAHHPLIHVTQHGIRFQDKLVRPDEVPRLLEKNRIPKDSTIHILVDEDYTDQETLWVFRHNYLTREGYSRSVLVHERQYQTGSRSELKPVSRKETIPYERRFPNKANVRR